MNRWSDRLEHLFSRCLDDEATPAERDLLKALCCDNPQVRRLFEEYRALDRLVGDSLRAAVQKPRYAVPLRARWTRAGKALAVAAAACLAALVWLHPTPSGPGPGSRAPTRAASLSWFAPPAPQVDTVEAVPAAYQRPQLRLEGIQRNWIVIPADEPGTFRIIEVDRVQRHVITVQRDF